MRGKRCYMLYFIVSYDLWDTPHKLECSPRLTLLAGRFDAPSSCCCWCRYCWLPPLSQIREPGDRREVSQQTHISSNQAVCNCSIILGHSRSTTRCKKAYYPLAMLINPMPCMILGHPLCLGPSSLFPTIHIFPSPPRHFPNNTLTAIKISFGS